MRRIKLMKWIYLIFFVLYASGAHADVYKDLEYGSLDREKLDIYTEDSLRNAPVIIHFHGGAWRIGNKRSVKQQPQAFNDAGYVFVSAGYPLLPKYPVETQAYSVAKAAAWVRRNIAQYGGDPTRIYLMGHSAGAHLATLVALDPRYLRQAGMGLSDLDGVLSIDGAGYDIPWRMRTFEERGARGRRIFANAFGEEEARWKALSPMTYVKRGQGIPPILFVTAASREISNEQSRAFRDALRAAGVRSEVAPIADRTHSSVYKKIGASADEPAFRAILDFIE